MATTVQKPKKLEVSEEEYMSAYKEIYSLALKLKHELREEKEKRDANNRT